MAVHSARGKKLASDGSGVIAHAGNYGEIHRRARGAVMRALAVVLLLSLTGCGDLGNALIIAGAGTVGAAIAESSGFCMFCDKEKPADSKQ